MITLILAFSTFLFVAAPHDLDFLQDALHNEVSGAG